MPWHPRRVQKTISGAGSLQAVVLVPPEITPGLHTDASTDGAISLAWCQTVHVSESLREPRAHVQYRVLV